MGSFNTDWTDPIAGILAVGLWLGLAVFFFALGKNDDL